MDISILVPRPKLFQPDLDRCHLWCFHEEPAMPCQPSRTLCGSKHPQCPFWVPAPAFHMPEMLGVNYCLVSHRVWWHCGTDGHACAGISDRHMLTLSQLFLCVRVVIPISPHHYSQIAQVGYQCCFWQHFVSLFHPVLISL